MYRHALSIALSLVAISLSGHAAADPERRLKAGQAELESGDHRAAADEFERGIEEAREKSSPPGTILAICVELADIYATYPDLGREAEAEALYLEARRIGEASLPAGHGNRIALLQRLGGYYYVRGRKSDAMAVLEQFMVEAETSIPPERLYASEDARMLRDAYSAAGNTEGLARLDRLRDDPAARRDLPSQKVAPIDASKLYLEPNARAADGTPMTVHFDPDLIPLRVSVPLPETPADGASPEQTREAAIAGMREWERAIAKLRPGYRIEFSNENANAPVQVVWSDRPPGYVGGSGTIDADEKSGDLHVSARVILSAKPLPGRGEKLGLGEVRANATHAFGGALGLSFCWECESIRSMGWRRRDEFLPTDLDVRTIEALWAVPNGRREAIAREAKGVLADLRFVNTGDDRHIFIDLAKPGSAPLVVQLDTGATTGFMTPVYARAIGVATRSAKSDPHRRETVTGRPFSFWVTNQAVVGGPASGMSYALLGGEYLESYVVEIDFPGRRVRLLDPAVHRVGGDPTRDGEHVIEMPVNEVRPYVTVEVGAGSVLALLDTGSMGTLSTTEEVAAKLGIAVDPKAKRRQWHNVLGTSLSSVQRVPIAKIGPATLHDVEFDIGLREPGGVRIERTLQGEMLLGQGLLREFVVRIDYARKKLGLTPVAR